MSIIQPTHSVEFPLQCMNFSKSRMKPDRKPPLTNASSVLLFPPPTICLHLGTLLLFPVKNPCVCHFPEIKYR